MPKPSTPSSINAQLRQVLKDYVAQFAQLNDAELEAMFEHLNIREYPAGKVLLREGQVGNRCYFVLQGCVRQYYLIDGLEKTTHFYTEGQPVLSTFSFDQQPSKFYLYCNEPCVLIVGAPEDEINFLQMFPQFESINRIGVEHELKKSQETFANYMLSTPESRYRNLLETRPDLLDRVPQYQLASYLGITPESLSRIRKRITLK